jgi:hypothetical protein
MASKHKPAKKRDPNQINAVAKQDEDQADAIARTVLQPTVQAAATLQEFGKSFGDLDVTSLMKSLNEQTEATRKNDLGRGEAMLVAQAHTLDAIFHVMARRAANNLGHYPETVDRYLKLAFRAQSQARATWEALSAMKNPPMVGYVKQANIAHGHQQVNNASTGPSTTSRPVENSNLQNKLLEEGDGKRLDTGTTGKTGQADSAMAAVGALDRAKDRRR